MDTEGEFWETKSTYLCLNRDDAHLGVYYEIYALKRMFNLFFHLVPCGKTVIRHYLLTRINLVHAPASINPSLALLLLQHGRTTSKFTVSHSTRQKGF